MRTTIPPPEHLFEDLLDVLEAIDQEQESDTRFKDLYSQFTAPLSDAHRALIATDGIRAAEARAAGEKYRGSHLTRTVELMILQALLDPDKFESYKIPVAVGDALLNLDSATPNDAISVFVCGSCRFSVDSVFLKVDAEKFRGKCPACGGTSV